MLKNPLKGVPQTPWVVWSSQIPSLGLPCFTVTVLKLAADHGSGNPKSERVANQEGKKQTSQSFSSLLTVKGSGLSWKYL